MMPTSSQHPNAVYSLMDSLRRLRVAIFNSSRLTAPQRNFLTVKTVEISTKRTEIYWTRMAFNGDVLRYRAALSKMQRFRYYPPELAEAVIKIGLHAETIYYLASVAFDLSTHITQSVYRASNLPFASFTKQMNRLIQNPSIDTQYSHFLQTMAGNYSTFKERRDNMTHYISAMIQYLQPNYPHGVFSNHPRTAIGADVVVKDAVDLLDNFLRFYDRHFCTLV